MFSYKTFVFYVFYILFAIVLTACQTAYSCPNGAAFSRAYKQKNIAMLKGFLGKIADCNETTKDEYRYFIARALYDDLGRRKQEQDIKPEDYNEIISVDANFWAALADLADHAMNARDYKTAAKLYEQALLDISGKKQEILSIKKDKDAIPENYIRDIQNKAENARLLASLNNNFIEPVRTRDGKLGGMHSFQIRGVKIAGHKYPIRFAYAKAELQNDKFNRANLALLIEALRANNNPSIKVVGHTDDIGSDKYNLQLSIKRAETIKNYLKHQMHYSGAIRIEGKGKKSMVKMHSARRAKLSDDEWRAINRRVEIIKTGDSTGN